MITDPTEWCASLFTSGIVQYGEKQKCETCPRLILIGSKRARFCTFCGQRRVNRNKNTNRKTHPCADCPTIVQTKSERCQPCAIKHRRNYLQTYHRTVRRAA